MAEKDYWKAMEKVKKDFRPGKPKTPEKKYLVVRQVETLCGLLIGKEIINTCKNLLDIYHYTYENETEYLEDVRDQIIKLLKTIKLPEETAKREIERLRGLRIEQAPFQLLLELRQTDDQGKKFWIKILHPILKREKEFRDQAINEIASRGKLKVETIKRLLKQAGLTKEMSIGRCYNEIISLSCKVPKM